LVKISILIADDHTLFREAWIDILSGDSRFEVVAQCGDTDEAIRLAKEKNPEIILMDINMMPLSGLDASKEILKSSPSCKIIGLSMHAEPAFAIKLISMGGRGYVTKNSSSDEMIQAILEVHKGKKFLCAEIKNNILGNMLDENSDAAKINSLTIREIQIIDLIKQGYTSLQIAESLEISKATVEAHRYNILKKLKLKNSTSLINFVHENKMTPLRQF
jgi:DNA-binding NarL/FixJ family response regulator